MRKMLRRLSERVINRLAGFNHIQWAALIAALAGIWLLLVVAVVLLPRPQRPAVSWSPSFTPPPATPIVTPLAEATAAQTPTHAPSATDAPQNTPVPGASPTLPGTPTSSPTPTPRGPQSFYAAPDGSPQGDGSRQNPWDLATALSDRGVVLPGDSLWLLGGSYGQGGDSLFKSHLSGSQSQPVTIRAAQGERATIDGGLEVWGDFSVVWGLEITNSETRRATQLSGSNPDDIERKGGISVMGSGTQLINNIIHDTKNGIEMWSVAVDTLAYGNIVYNNGFRGPDRTHGHGIYAQNQNGTKTFENNIVFNNFSSYNFHIYTEEGFIQGFLLAGNIAFNGQFLVGGLQPAARINVMNNHLYHSRARFGYKNEANADLTLKDNYFGGSGEAALEVKWWQTLDVSGNTIWNDDRGNVELLLPAQPGDYHWDNNTYYAGERNAFTYSGRAAGWEQWKKRSSFDAQSAFRQGEPQGQAVFITPDRFEPGRATVVIYNWDEQDAAQVDLSQAGLQPGERYRIRNAQNYYAEVIEGVYEGGQAAIPMTGWSAAIPVGLDEPLEENTFPEFGVFIVEKL